MIELVTWRDAFFYKDVPDNLPDDYIVTTVGWVEEGERFLRVSSERLPHDDGDRCVTSIPNECVVKRVPMAFVEPAYD